MAVRRRPKSREDIRHASSRQVVPARGSGNCRASRDGGICVCAGRVSHESGSHCSAIQISAPHTVTGGCRVEFDSSGEVSLWGSVPGVGTVQVSNYEIGRAGAFHAHCEPGDFGFEVWFENAHFVYEGATEAIEIVH